MDPRVSIIVPSYNHSRYLPRRLASIFEQTFRDYEVLILDDASTDDSLQELIRHHSKPGVRFVINQCNSGSAFPQWNRGIMLARGQYIWIAESDDVADPRFLQTLVPVMDENPNVGLAYCQSQLVNKQGEVLGTSLDWTHDLDPTRWQASFVNHGPDEIRSYLVKKNTIPNASAVLARRSVLLETLPVDTSYTLCGDWLHWGKVLLRSDVAYVGEALNQWRMASSNSRPLPPGLLEWKEGQRVIRYLAKEVEMTETQTCQVLLCFAERCFAWLSESLGAALGGRAAAEALSGAAQVVTK
jgi:glycosyltransferase involved in cell wall biosynthesis